jgi:hypothetical protein
MVKKDGPRAGRALIKCDYVPGWHGSSFCFKYNVPEMSFKEK